MWSCKEASALLYVHDQQKWSKTLTMKLQKVEVRERERGEHIWNGWANKSRRSVGNISDGVKCQVTVTQPESRPWS